MVKIIIGYSCSLMEGLTEVIIITAITIIIITIIIIIIAITDREECRMLIMTAMAVTVTRNTTVRIAEYL